MKKFKILFVGGTWNRIQNETLPGLSYTYKNDELSGPIVKSKYGQTSGLVKKTAMELSEYAEKLTVYNGGDYDMLKNIIEKEAHEYDIVFWWANVDNSLPKVRDVKEAAPHVMLVTSKRNDHDRYTFMELNQRALASKSNLVFEFKKVGSIYHVMVFDPLGCEWYEGFDFEKAVKCAIDRLAYLTSITRQKTTSVDTNNGLVLKWYFDCFEQNQTKSEKDIVIPDEQRFVELVKKYAERFHEILKPAPNVKRFLGNCSMKPFPPQVGRCSKGMPSFRKDGYVFVSQRNVDKEYLTIENFVPTYLENGNVYYCGDKKPSVDTPIQLRLYEKLPNIHYMIHAHVYVKGAPFTTKPIPCGAIEEVDEIIETLLKEHGTLDGTKYQLNLFGHGSIIMGETIDDLTEVEYIGRTLPEAIGEKEEKITVTLTQSQAKAIECALYHQYNRISDDDGEPVTCKQSTLNATYEAKNIFEDLCKNIPAF